MKSGICTGKDFEKFFADVDDDNTTMIRIIASYAGKAYESARESGMQDIQELSRLYTISCQGQATTEENLLTQFDALTDVFQRALHNSALIPHWQELTGEIIETF